MASAYPVSPSPTAGNGAFGLVPGQVALPNPAQDLAAQYPDLAGSTGVASADVLAKMRGDLSPGTINSIQDAAARFGVSSGMPGLTPGSLAGNRGIRDIGLNAESQTQQGLQDFNALTSNVSNTQTVNPALQANIAETNAVNAAAPNPQQAQSYAQSLFDKYLNLIHGGKAGGTNSPPMRAGGGGQGTAGVWGLTPGDPTNPPAQQGTGQPGGSASWDSLSPWTSPAPMNPYGAPDMSTWFDSPQNNGYITPLTGEEWATGFS